MVATPIHPPETIRIGRRALEEYSFCELLEDWIWYSKINRWGLRCRIKIESSSDSIVPSMTDWYIIVSPTYPWGDIILFPAKDGGLRNTFHHQKLNSLGDQDLPWRNGEICVQTSLRTFSRRSYDEEPISPDARLGWYLFRAREWLLSASQGNLVQPGDPFELPFIPHRSKDHVGFIEDPASYNRWSILREACGYVTLVRHRTNTDLLALKSFRDFKDNEICEYRYGFDRDGSWIDYGLALWIKLSSLPVLSPWQIPTTFGELQSVLSQQNIDLKNAIFRLSRPIRDGRRHFMLLGFPIANKIGEESDHFHWLCFRLPQLSYGKIKGFRQNEKGYKRLDELTVLRDDLPIDWVMTRNWHSDQIGSRGNLPAEVTNKKILIIGAGALGSCIALLLARAGSKDILILDDDLIEIGNLSRHTATLSDLGNSKAQAVASELSTVSPNTYAYFIAKKFAECNEAEKEEIHNRDIVFDCTASDNLLNDLALFQWHGEKLFVSISFGLYARRLFYFAFQGNGFPHDMFARCITPHISRERGAYGGIELPREGIGCWHPVFPARTDDIWFMTSLALKLFEYDCLNRPVNGVFRVYEQYTENDLPAGIRKACENNCP